jgi:hypothetical protein
MPSLLVKCDSQLTADVIPYNNRNDGGSAAGLLSLVEVPEKAIVPFMVNAFDYVTFIHRLVVKFLTKLSLDALKKNLRFTKYLDFSVF